MPVTGTMHVLKAVFKIGVTVLKIDGCVLVFGQRNVFHTAVNACSTASRRSAFKHEQQWRHPVQ